ncbi:MAG: hypothetical protein GW808_11250 [Sphingomonadales bacterium]|nr:hypothetical protein [Sphingomonadales bacterium]PIX67400.1 MAG: hypothetical protein COZ43_01630 [Sphingomonadales bacterium CG_4_10_14_3_um_filter_58_15]NCO47572.1 hypothetical protein [Sphingomonadales bacterium]NCP01608.1 hypothetical protein [Sphingomonadales bacterium]NCP26453.1 hypothetical protein [Sphingomonadales bacterium]
MASEKSDEEQMWDTFIGKLAFDVQRSLDRYNDENIESNKRDVVRTIVAAIEGITWAYREHVQEIGITLEASNSLYDLAFSEKTYSISEKGDLKMRPNFIPTVSMIRLITNRAKELCPQLDIDFSGSGWSDLRKAISIRNRITHPKASSDLKISESEIQTARSGFFWFISFVPDVMGQTNQSLQKYAKTLTNFIEDLKSGDTEALRLYRYIESIDEN